MSQETTAHVVPEPIPERAEHAEAVGQSATNGLIVRGAVVAAVGLFAAVAMYATTGTKAPIATVATAKISQGSFEPAVVPPSPVPLLAEAAIAARPAPLQPLALGAPMEAPKGPDMMDLARRAPVLAFSKSDQLANTGNRVLGWAEDTKPEDGGTFGKLLKPTALEGARAGHIGDRDYVIAMGTSIPCVLETALSSDQPGFSTCVINRDVMSDNGRVALLEKGTQVIGEYRGGLKQGQQRLFVLWTRAKTPTGVIVTLGSPATDALGRAGFDGQVDTHWWDRFGSALLLSVVSDASTFAGQRLSANGIQANNASGSGKQAASIAVEQGGAMAPTLNKHQGELVNIMVGRDLDFSAVYKLRLLPPAQRGPSWSVAIGVGSIAAIGGTAMHSLKD